MSFKINLSSLCLHFRLRSWFFLSVLNCVFFVGCSSEKTDFLHTNQKIKTEAFSDAIVNGEVVVGSSHLSQSVVSLQRLSADKESFEIYCTGTLIKSNVVLTAAHCIADDLDQRKNLRIGFAVDDSITSLISSAVIHPLYKQTMVSKETASSIEVSAPNDIALLFLAGPIPETVTTAVLNEQVLSVGDKRVLQIFGYGMNHDLAPQTAGLLRQVALEAEVFSGSSDSISIDQKTLKKGICYGDSGGPSFSQVKNHWLLTAVTSHLNYVQKNIFGHAKGDRCLYQGDLLLVAPFIDWIKTTIDSKSGTSSNDHPLPSGT